MGPLGFALGLDGALDKCAADEASVEWATWYLDDGTIIGSPEAVGNYLASLTIITIPIASHIRRIGGEENKKKPEGISWFLNASRPHPKKIVG